MLKQRIEAFYNVIYTNSLDDILNEYVRIVESVVTHIQVSGDAKLIALMPEALRKIEQAHINDDYLLVADVMYAELIPIVEMATEKKA